MMTAFNRFGGARLPNGLEMINRDYGLYDQIVGVGRIARRAVGTNVRQLFYPVLFAHLGTSSLQTWHTLGQRLGARLGSDQVLGPCTSWISGEYLCRSGASPHQSTLMTKIKTFVPYFRYPVVFL